MHKEIYVFSTFERQESSDTAHCRSEQDNFLATLIESSFLECRPYFPNKELADLFHFKSSSI